AARLVSFVPLADHRLHHRPPPPNSPSIFLLSRLRASLPLFPYTALFRSIRTSRVAATDRRHGRGRAGPGRGRAGARQAAGRNRGDRKSTRLNSSHVKISDAVFRLKKEITRLMI